MNIKIIKNIIICSIIFFLLNTISYAEDNVIYDYVMDPTYLGTFRLYSDKGSVYDFNSAAVFRLEPIDDKFKLVLDMNYFNNYIEILENKFSNEFSDKILYAYQNSNGTYSIKKGLYRCKKIDRKVFADIIAKKIFESDYSILKIPTVSNKKDVELCLLSSSITYYDSSKYNRSSNIRVGGNHIGGTKVKPGEVFSFNKKTDEVSNKMLLAPVISGNGYTLGKGGGLCQVSTTLFNASLDSGLEIVTRSPHTYAQNYVKRGRDAMVSNWSDFKFKNNFNHDIYIIYKQPTNNSICFEIYGNNKDKKNVKTYVTNSRGKYLLHREIDGKANKIFYSSYAN